MKGLKVKLKEFIKKYHGEYNRMKEEITQLKLRNQKLEEELQKR